jgi:energy-coupling factor transporter ATP-binding protein EcfA2
MKSGLCAAFPVSLSPGQAEACGLSGRLAVAPDSLLLDVATNTCDASEIGQMVRAVVERHRDEFVLRTPDGRSTYRYTRRLHAD